MPRRRRARMPPQGAKPPQDMKPPQDTNPPQTAPILSPLPVKNSVLHQLSIADNELPHGLARLKHNLLLSPSHTLSQESNICSNSGSIEQPIDLMKSLLERVYDTMAESGPDPDMNYESKKKTFKSMSYLDQIALVCLAAGVYVCQAPDCLQYRRKLERVVPVCQSWPGLRDWVLCITSCSLRTIGENWVNRGYGNRELKQNPLAEMEDESKLGLVVCNQVWLVLLQRLKAHLGAFVLLTAPPGASYTWTWILRDILERETPEETADESGSIGGDDILVRSRRCPWFTPEFLTCRRHVKLAVTFTIALHQGLGLTFICKHLILYKREALQVHQLMLLKFSS